MNGTTPPVTFDFQTWITLFPEFAPLGASLGAAYFMIATGKIIANSTTNPAFNDGNLPLLCYLATSHVAWLLCSKDANGNPSTAASASPASQQVGRVSQASQGTVNVTLDWPTTADSSAMEKYLTQTKYGAELWAALSPYRTARYVAQPLFVFGGRFRRHGTWPLLPGFWA